MIDIKEVKLYWNYACGGVELEKTDDNCPILKSPHDDRIVTESWWTDYTHTHTINFSYRRGDFYDRDMFFKSNNVNPQELRWIMLPESEYEELVEHYKAESATN